VSVLVAARPLTDLVVEDVGALVWEVAVLAMVLFVVALADAAVIIPLTRAFVSGRISTRPLTDLVIEHIGAIMFDRRFATEALVPAVGAIAISSAINVIAASRAFACFVGERLHMFLTETTVVVCFVGAVVVGAVVGVLVHLGVVEERRVVGTLRHFRRGILPST
jgi:hypothetical protein